MSAAMQCKKKWSHPTDRISNPVSVALIPATGFLRLGQIIGNRQANPSIPPIIPVSRSHWLDGVKQNIYPQPVKGLGKRITVWDVRDILALVETLRANNKTDDGVDAHIPKQERNHG